MLFLSIEAEDKVFIISLAMVLAVLILYVVCHFLIKKNKKKRLEAKPEAVTEEQVEDKPDNKQEEAPQEVEGIDDIISSEEPISEAPQEEEALEEADPDPLVEAPVTEIKEQKKEKAPAKPKRVYKGKFEIFPQGDGYAYQLKASNGETMIVSESFASRDSAIKSIDAVKKNLETGDVNIFVDKKGNYQFKLVSKNHRVLAMSAKYSSEKSAISAANSFKNFAFNADIVDVIYEDTDFAEAIVIEVKSKPKAGGKYFVEKYEGIFYWVLKANNGQILCQSNGYTSKASCQSGITTFKSNVETGVFKCVKDKNETYCYKLYNQAGRLCAVGESCPTLQAATSQAKSVKSFYATEDIILVK